MYDAIYLSPHLDDAVLSCGGQIFQRTAVSQKIRILTIMAGDPPQNSLSKFAQGQHQSWQLLSEATAQRRAEDITACQLLGAEHTHWQIPDCIYRHHPETGTTFYNSDDDIFGDVHPQEQLLVTHLAQQFAKLPPHHQIFAPLTLGNHVDHQIVRQAAEQCFSKKLFFYEDYPYVQRLGGVTAVIPPNAPYQAQTIPLTPNALQTKINAIAAYPSQLTNLFSSKPAMIDQVTTFTKTTTGERIWQITNHNS